MTSNWLRFLTLGLLAASLACAGCGSGSDGRDGVDGQDGAPGGSSINVSQVSDEYLEGLDIISRVTNVEIASPPVVTFELASALGVPITGIVPYWEDDHHFVRFTIAKLVPGTNGDPDSWVSYVYNDEDHPSYDDGASLVDNGDGSYVFTFMTDIATVPGVTYEPTLTHRVAGQMGGRGIPIEPQNFLYNDFVPAGGAVTTTRDIAVMESCNECHVDLVFHGRRFLVEYCVNCHNPDLGEGDMAYMTHKIHAGGTFDVLDGGIDYSYMGYPQDLMNCRKCHTSADAKTPDGDNWKMVPSKEACLGCHELDSIGVEGNPHPADEADNSGCAGCHPADDVEEKHIVPNATPNNPLLFDGQHKIRYQLVDVEVNGNVVIRAKIYDEMDDIVELDMTDLPADMLAPGQFPAFLVAYALPQDGIEEPADYNNRGRRGGQPLSLDLNRFLPLIHPDDPSVGTVSFADGVNTFTITDAGSQFPPGATLRAIGLQGYFQQELDGDDVSLHTPSAVMAVMGDEVRRSVVDSAACAKCHEWFEGHGGNRTLNMQICVLCHLPNQSSSGRTVEDPTDRDLDEDLQAALDDETLDDSVDPSDPTTYPEDAQNLKDLVHGIHSGGPNDHDGFRTRPYQHVRGGRQGYYDWSHVVFPRGASTSDCSLCHDGGSYELPLPENLLATTVRTTLELDGMDPTVPDAEAAFVAVPNLEDWINTPAASSCFYCHTSIDALAHMEQNGAWLSWPALPLGNTFQRRSMLMYEPNVFESCAVCHGPGKAADLDLVHNK